MLRLSAYITWDLSTTYFFSAASLGLRAKGAATALESLLHVLPPLPSSFLPVPFLSGGNLSYWCCCSVSPSCPTLCDPTNCSMPGLPVSRSLSKFMSTASVIPILLIPIIYSKIWLYGKTHNWILPGSVLLPMKTSHHRNTPVIKEPRCQESFLPVLKPWVPWSFNLLWNNSSFSPSLLRVIISHWVVLCT